MRCAPQETGKRNVCSKIFSTKGRSSGSHRWGTNDRLKLYRFWGANEQMCVGAPKSTMEKSLTPAGGPLHHGRWTFFHVNPFFGFSVSVALNVEEGPPGAVWIGRDILCR